MTKKAAPAPAAVTAVHPTAMRAIAHAGSVDDPGLSVTPISALNSLSLIVVA